MSAPSDRPLRLFVSFAPEDRELKDELLKHLTVLQRIGRVEPWSVDQVRAGADWQLELEAALERADVALLLLSADFLASEFLQDIEVPRLFQRRANDGLHVIPIMMRTCSWQFHSWIGRLKPLPAAEKSVAAHEGDSRDQALTEIARAVASLFDSTNLREVQLPELLFRDVEPLPNGIRTMALDALERGIRRLTADELATIGRLITVLQEPQPPSQPSSHSATAPHTNPSRPAPNYPDDETRLLSEKLADAQARRQRFLERGVDPVEADREILDLKRRLREGGHLKPGDSLGDGRYLLLDVVGRGGFAIVWRAHDAKTNEVVAIKVLHSSLAGDRLRLERFRRGARIMNKIRHDAILRVVEPCREDVGWHYFVMPYMSGGDLRRAVSAGTTNWTRVKGGILQICEAMGRAHANGIVHRDIKPANILLDGDGSLKLTDFDLVGAGDTTGGTRTGALGTFVYTAPEAMERPHEADSRADVFSLGMTIAFCVYGRDLPATTVGRPASLIDSLSCSDALKVILRKATAWEDKGLRYANATALGMALAAVNALDGTTVSSSELPAQGTGDGIIQGPPTESGNEEAPASASASGSLEGKHVEVGDQRPLSDASSRVLHYIRQSITERGYPPTLREIGAHMGIRSTNGVNRHLRALERKGYLMREGMKSRALRPRDLEPAFTPRPEASNGEGGPTQADDQGEDIVEIPVVGRIAAGLPVLTEEHVLDTVRIERNMVGGGHDVFGLRVNGDSMIEAGIISGDYIFVRKQHKANRGDIVAILIGDEAAIAYYYPERDYVRLQPANARMAPILIRAGDFRPKMILGVVVGVYRKQ